MDNTQRQDDEKTKLADDPKKHDDAKESALKEDKNVVHVATTVEEPVGQLQEKTGKN